MTQFLLTAIGEGRADDAKARRGVVLIVVMGILMILAMMVIVFVTFQRLELKVAGSFADSVRAKMLALSGVEATLDLVNSQSARTMAYWGADNDEEGPGVGNISAPLEQAVNPSFAVEVDGDPDNVSPLPRTIVVDGQVRGFSGAMATGAYGLNSDVYAVRVADTSGTIYVNEGLDHPYRKAVLERILNRLGDELTPAIATLGTKMITFRPPTGYASKEQAMAACSLTQLQMDALSSNITTYAWRDPDVANPVPLSNDAKAAYQVPTATFSDPDPANPVLISTRPTGASLGRYGRGMRVNGVLNAGLMMFHGTGPGESTSLRNTSIYGWDELNARYIEVSPRAPVNVNSASKQVLYSLLVDLQGMVLVEQKHPCGNYMMGYVHGLMYYDYLSSDVHYPGATSDVNNTYQYSHTAGEIGVLFKTTAIDPVLARTVADEIIACRNKAVCGNLHGGATHDYAVLPFGGPFTNWQQFHMFVDWLVEDQDEDPPSLADAVIKDLNLRGAASVNAGFYVYPAQANTDSGDPASGSSAYQAFGSQAMADVIKANFNPNLHLNEVNPDRGIFLHVDKTDLIQPSTEFCFRPTGTYEIESLGRVLAPVGDLDALTAPNNVVRAEKKVTAVVRLFTPKRFTTQRQFYGDSAGFEGTVGANFHTISTSSDGVTALNKALMIGPEVDNGPAPAENGYEGYICLSTYGGSLPGVTTKAPKALVSTGSYYNVSTISEGTTGVDATAHAHYDFDFDLHGSKTRNTPLTVSPYSIALTIAGLSRDIIHPPQASTHHSTPGSGGFWNYHDRTEFAGLYQSPYTPAYDKTRYWLATSYSWDGTAVPPAPKLPSYYAAGDGSGRSLSTLTAPSDLRIDGAYVERHSGLLYLPDGDNKPETLTDNNIDSRYGTCAYWIKTGFEPDLTGRHRQLWGIDAGGRGGWTRGAMKMFGHWWLASSKHGNQASRVGYRVNQNVPATNDYDDWSSSTAYPNLFWNNLMFGGCFQRVAGKPADSLFPPSDIAKKLSGPGAGPYTPHQWASSTKLTHYMWSDGSDTPATTHDHPLVPKHRQLALPHQWTHLMGSYVKQNDPLITDAEIYPKLYRLIHGVVDGAGNYQAPRVDWRMLVNGREVNPAGGNNAKINRLYPNWGTQHENIRNFKAGGASGPAFENCCVYWDNNGNPFYLWFVAKDSVNEKPMWPTPINNILYRRHEIIDYVFNDDVEKYKKDVPMPPGALDANGQPYTVMCPWSIGSPSYADPRCYDNTDSIDMWSRNYPPDCTIDEVYMFDKAYNAGAITAWGLPGFTDPKKLWDKGRYYRKSDGVYESPLLDPSTWIAGSVARVLPQPAAIAVPSGGGVAGTTVPPPGGAGGTVPRIVGVSWSVYGDPHRDPMTNQTVETGLQTRSSLRTFTYLLHDYNATDQELPPVDLNPEIRLLLSNDGGVTWGPPLTKWEYETVDVSVVSGQKLKFKLEFKWEAVPNAIDPINSVLLQTPVVDDVTFYLQDVSYVACWFSP